MYNGNERFMSGGEYLADSVSDFWRWAYSGIIDNTVRGVLTEYIVKTALDRGGYSCNSYRNVWNPYDLSGPPIPHLNPQRNARIEVKSAAYIQSWGKSNRIAFSIAPAMILSNGNGNIPQSYVRQRNNDLYVLALYTADDDQCNMLDLDFWNFYVIPTYQIEDDPKLCTQKTISLKKVRSLCTARKYSELCDAIVNVCNSITTDVVHTFAIPE